MDINKDMAARVCTLVAEGVSPDVAALQVIGTVNHPAVDVIEQLQRSEGMDYSSVILKVAARGLEGHRTPPPPDQLADDLDTAKDLLHCVSSRLEDERTLTCALGVALRQVLPFAENEVAGLHDSAQRDGDEDVASLAEDGSRSVHRARVVLKRLDRSHMPVHDLKDDHFDESFNIKFED